MNFQPKPLSTLLILVFMLVPTMVTAQTRNVIPMNYKNGIYTIPCEVNGLTMKFIFDSGASTTQIGLSEALFMLKNDYLSRKDLGDDIELSIADGSTILGREISIRSLKVGNQEFNNVDAIVVEELSAPLLLGQNIMSQNSALVINYELQTIEFIESENKRFEDIDPNTRSATQTMYDSVLTVNESLYKQIQILNKSIVLSEANRTKALNNINDQVEEQKRIVVMKQDLANKYLNELNDFLIYYKSNITLDRSLPISKDVIKLFKKKGLKLTSGSYRIIYVNPVGASSKGALFEGTKYYELGSINGSTFIYLENGTTGWLR
jgi:hypothetical protein